MINLNSVEIMQIFISHFSTKNHRAGISRNEFSSIPRSQISNLRKNPHVYVQKSNKILKNFELS